MSFEFPSELGGARLCRLELIGCSPFSGRNLSALHAMSGDTDSNNEVDSPILSVSNSSPQHVYSSAHSATSSSENETEISTELRQLEEPPVAADKGYTTYTPREVPRGGDTTCSAVGTSSRLQDTGEGTSRSKKRARLGRKPVTGGRDTVPSKNDPFEDVGECSFENFSSESVPPPIPHLGPVVRPSSNQSASDGNVGGERSELTPEDLARIAVRYPWPRGVSLSLPDPQARPAMDFGDHMVMFEGMMEYGGFRLPLADFLVEFLNDIELAPWQLTYNSWIYLVAIAMRCFSLGDVPTLNLYRAVTKISVFKYPFYSISVPKVRLIVKRSNMLTWKPRWFLVKASEDLPFIFRTTAGKVTIKKVKKKQADLLRSYLNISVDEKREIRSWSEIATRARLERAGLSLYHRRNWVGGGILVNAPFFSFFSFLLSFYRFTDLVITWQI